MTATVSPAPHTLYTIEDDILAALDTLEGLPEEEADLRAECEEHIARLIAQETRKVDSVGRMLAHFESQAELAAKEIRRLQAHKKQFQSAYDRLEASAKLAVELSGRNRLEGETSALCLQKNPPAVFIRDFNAVPPEYMISQVVVSPDKDAIKRAIKAGFEVPGAELVQSERLVIR